MAETNEVFLYVANPQVSGDFYGALFGTTPYFTSPVFVMMALPSGLSIGLWRMDNVAPEPQALNGGFELGYKLANAAEVDALHAKWEAAGVTIAQQPTSMGFGYTFLGLDPDGHRLRVYAPPQF